MGQKKNVCLSIIYLTGIIIFILEPKTVVDGSKDGIFLCLFTIIPSLFPFIVLSIQLTKHLLNCQIKWLRPLAKICTITKGTEQFIFLGFLGGYPVGAQAISEAYSMNYIESSTARRMLSFCSNAGPSFIFGMLSPIFTNKNAVWSIWIIHILSALLVAIIYPKENNINNDTGQLKTTKETQGLLKSIKTMSTICGWVVIFRVLLAYLTRWVLWIVPLDIQILISGLLELANGCVNVQHLSTEGKKFLWTSMMLGFGGICVLAQTRSVTGSLGIRSYLTGKILQSAISFLLAYCMQFVLFERQQQFIVSAFTLVIPVITIVSIVYYLYWKKTVAIHKKIIYNIQKHYQEEHSHAVS